MVYEKCDEITRQQQVFLLTLPLHFGARQPSWTPRLHQRYLRTSSRRTPPHRAHSSAPLLQAPLSSIVFLRLWTHLVSLPDFLKPPPLHLPSSHRLALLLLEPPPFQETLELRAGLEVRTLVWELQLFLLVLVPQDRLESPLSSISWQQVLSSERYSTSSPSYPCSWTSCLVLLSSPLTWWPLAPSFSFPFPPFQSTCLVSPFCPITSEQKLIFLRYQPS